MLIYDWKQMGRLHRWLLPAVLFAVIVIAVRLDTIFEVFEEGELLAYGWTLQFILDTLQTDAVLLAAPVLCTFPYAAACVDEVKSGMVKAILSRTDRRHYIFSKAAASLISGAAVLLTGAAIVCGTAFLLFPFMETAPETGMNQNEAIRTLIGLLGRYGCFGALWSLAGMWMSILTLNRFMAWVSPFMIDYLLTILYERYFDGMLLFYPKQWLVRTWEWPFADAGVCLWLILLGSLLLMLVMRTGRRMLERAV